MAFYMMIFVVWLIFILILVLPSSKKKKRKEDAIKLTYREFLKYYNLNPEKWSYEVRSPYYGVKCIYYEKKYGYIKIYLNKINYLRANRMFKKKDKLVKKYETYNKKKENELEFLECMQKDIEEIKAKSTQEINEGKKIVLDISKRQIRSN